MTRPKQRNCLVCTAAFAVCIFTAAQAAPDAGLDGDAPSYCASDPRIPNPVADCREVRACKARCNTTPGRQTACTCANQRRNDWGINGVAPKPEGMVGGAILSQP